LTEQKLKIAVFIDFDNIEIGVKTTLGGQFDVGAVLEAIKERGEVVTKVAYSDWKRAGDQSRQLSQHAIRMVQRNLTPGGDKNGADINLALDALEMAFTHDHINAFVIVGGDSDFITLVEKLKQYDKKVFVVGGRQFTSLVMQKNCHEFVAYENLVSSTRRSASPAGKQKAGGPGAPVDVDKAVPLVKRALKVLEDREVTPQLGLLKSTLLQLDSTFSERDYGAGTFRDFIDKVAARGVVTLRQSGRSVLVELVEQGGTDADQAMPAPATHEPVQHAAHEPVPHAPPAPAHVGRGEAAAAVEAAEREVSQAAAASPEQAAEAVATAARLFSRAKQPPRWPMYIRQVRQFLRTVDETFDERKFGFSGVVEFLRACQREGLLRLDRDRQGVLRVFAGPQLARTAESETPSETHEHAEAHEPIVVTAGPAEPVVEAEPVMIPETDTILDGEVEDIRTDARSGEADSQDARASAPTEDAEQQPQAARPRGTRKRAASGTKKAAAPKTAAKPRAPRARKTAKTVTH
jgi:uncharacterized LabA/DUF88 family protein